MRSAAGEERKEFGRGSVARPIESAGLRIPSIFVSALIASASATQVHAAPAPVRYACSTSEELTLERTSASAHVTIGGHSYELKRAPSSIGNKYLSTNAALIIDGPSLVFVTDEKPNLGPCIKAVPVASSH